MLLDYRGGCKVGWHVWSTREEAEADSPKQRSEAARKAGLGYDFGYCVPGEVREVTLREETTFRGWGKDAVETTLPEGTVVYEVTTP